MTAEISARLAKASRAFGTLRSSVFSSRDLSVKTKVHVYSAVVLSTLLYGCETWAIKAVDVRRLAAFHHRCVRFLLDIRRVTQWQEHISNNTLLERAKVQPIEEALKTRRLRWLGHVARMDDSRMPKCILFGELDKTQPRHGPRKRWRDNVGSDMKDRQIADWYDLAQDRREWRLACSTIPPTEPVTLDFVCTCGKRYRRRQDLTRHARFCS